MNAAVLKPEKERRLTALRAALGQGTLRSAHRMVNALHPAEIARLIESLPPAQREIVWDVVDPELEGEVLVELNENIRAQLMEGMEPEELVAVTEGMDFDDVADLVADLPETLTLQLLRSLDQQDRERLRTVLSFPEDSAGGLMNTDAISLRPDVSVEVVLRYLRMRGELPRVAGDPAALGVAAGTAEHARRRTRRLRGVSGRCVADLRVAGPRLREGELAGVQGVAGHPASQSADPDGAIGGSGRGSATQAWR